VLGAAAIVAHVLHQQMPVIEAWTLSKLFVMADVSKGIVGPKP